MSDVVSLGGAKALLDEIRRLEDLCGEQRDVIAQAKRKIRQYDHAAARVRRILDAAMARVDGAIQPTDGRAHGAGGLARAAKLSPERRREIARVAAKARWAP